MGIGKLLFAVLTCVLLSSSIYGQDYGIAEFTNVGNEINCITAKFILKDKEKDINSFNCSECTYETLRGEIKYAPNKIIAEEIEAKKKTLRRKYVGAGFASKNRVKEDKYHSFL
ncbi:MAG: hypothetical protein JKX84_07620, partial [Flavobacteriales bacterium]|nr:hypothetical protein [Flavobacteriales bacterium]